MKIRCHSVLALTAFALVAVEANTPARQSSGEKLHFSAFAVSMNNISAGATAQVEIQIDSWTTEAERQRFIEIAISEGQDALLRAFQKAPSRGRIWFPNMQGPDPTNIGLGWPLRYTHQTRTDEGGRRVVIATDRVMTFWERANRPRTVDYPFTLIQIEVDKDGTGEGRMAVATRINFDKNRNVMELEHFASEPVRLQNVKMTVKQS